MRQLKGKLKLKRETLRALAAAQLAAARGGISQPTAGDNCTTSFTEPGHMNTCLCDNI